MARSAAGQVSAIQLARDWLPSGWIRGWRIAAEHLAPHRVQRHAAGGMLLRLRAQFSAGCCMESFVGLHQY